MTTVISPVLNQSIDYGVLIDLTLNGTAYYISNCYTPVSYDGNTYQALAGFLNIGEIQSNISNANDELQISLSAIPAEYIPLVLGDPIKGGEINIYRVFFDYDTQLILANGVFKRYAGVISNFAVQEDLEAMGTSPEVTHTITITASSIMGVLENKVSGRRTNRKDYQIVYTELNNSATDPSMDRVETLFNSSFDFGRPYKGTAASTVAGAAADDTQRRDDSPGQ